MNITSAAYDSLSPTNLYNFENRLRLPGDDGITGIVDASDAHLRIMTGTESVEVLPGKKSEFSAYQLERNGKTHVNPTIRIRTGTDFSAELANGLDEETTHETSEPRPRRGHDNGPPTSRPRRRQGDEPSRPAQPRTGRA